jgi:aspartate racemase
MLTHVPHIGIVAGTADGAALCYRTLCHEAEGLTEGSAQPEITMHALPLDAYLAFIDANHWVGVAALMSRSASVLAKAGAELIICPNNTLHRAFGFVTSPVPWLHIAAAVATEAAHSSYRRLGLLGTQAVVQGAVYQPVLEQQGIEVLLPEEDEQRLLDTIIRTELIRGRYRGASRRRVTDALSSMAARGAEAVILGCTELPLLLDDDHSVLPLLDSTRILARAALHRIVAGMAPPLVFTTN